MTNIPFLPSHQYLMMIRQQLMATHQLQQQLQEAMIANKQQQQRLSALLSTAARQPLGDMYNIATTPLAAATASTEQPPLCKNRKRR
jgi:hypothetical protein